MAYAPRLQIRRALGGRGGVQPMALRGGLRRAGGDVPDEVRSVPVQIQSEFVSQALLACACEAEVQSGQRRSLAHCLLAPGLLFPPSCCQPALVLMTARVISEAMRAHGRTARGPHLRHTPTEVRRMNACRILAHAPGRGRVSETSGDGNGARAPGGDAVRGTRGGAGT